LYLPRIMRPVPEPGFGEEATRWLTGEPVVLVRGLVGSIVTEQLAGTLAARGGWSHCVWLRAVAGGSVPVAQDLAEACRHRWELEGPPGTLPELLRDAPPDATLVVETGARGLSGLRGLAADLRRSSSEQRAHVVVIVEGGVGGRWLPGLGLAPLDGVPSEVAGRLDHLARHRPAVAHDVMVAARVRGASQVEEALERSWSVRAFLDRLTALLLPDCDADEIAALRSCLETGYWHPSLTQSDAAADRLRPWLVPLEDGWYQMRRVWARPLRRHLPDRIVAGPPPVEHGRRPPRRTPPVIGTARRPLLQARLFGELQLRVDGRPVPRWAGQRGISVLRFLLARPEHACYRDQLLATFWPDVDPDTARNRLQVAVSGVRRSLLAVTGERVVEYVDGRYRIDPAIKVEVDVERFEAALARARRCERADDDRAALAAYGEAIQLYRGDFAADSPYDQWSLVTRETLRLAAVDALDRAGALQLARHDLDGCIATAQRMLDLDPCREDAHRMLMHCYARQGRAYQAQQQYEFCVRVLRSTLDVDPAPATTRLRNAIRAGSAPSRP
jgi:DNA-binding SARP family transcriptional activator